jgi:hypothetical protein
MKFRINSLNIREGNWFVKELFVERKGETCVKTVTVKDSNAKNSSDKVEIRKVIRVDA